MDQGIEEVQAEDLFNKAIANLGKEKVTQIQEAFSTSSGQDQNRTPYIILQSEH